MLECFRFRCDIVNMQTFYVPITYVVLWTLQAISSKHFLASCDIVPTLIVLCNAVEICKLSVCLVGLVWVHDKRHSWDGVLQQLKPTKWIVYSAFCFNVYNALMYSNIGTNDLALYKLFLSSRVPFAIMFSYVVFGRHPDFGQSAGAMLVMSGCCMLTMFNCPKNALFTSSATIVLLLQASMSALGGALNEKGIKISTACPNSFEDLASKNIQEYITQLCLFTGVIFLSMSVGLIQPVQLIAAVPPVLSLSGIMVLLLSTMAGLWTSFLLLKLDNVVKTLCTTVELITVSAASFFVFSSPLPRTFWCASLLVVLGILVFSRLLPCVGHGNAQSMKAARRRRALLPSRLLLGGPIGMFVVALAMSQYACKPPSSSWHTIWSAKKDASKPPHILNGFDNLSAHDYAVVVNSLLNATILQSQQFNPTDLKSLLDVGCGAGAFLSILSKRFPTAKLFGVDFSPSLVEHAQKQLADADIRVADILQPLPFANNSFDFTASFSVLFYLPNFSAVYNLLDELHRVTKPSGYIWLADVSDLAKQHIARIIRMQTHTSSSSTPPHLYIPQSVFLNFSQKSERPLTTVNENFVAELVPSYLQSLYRTSYLLQPVSQALQNRATAATLQLHPHVMDLRLAQFPMFTNSTLLQIGCEAANELILPNSKKYLTVYCTQPSRPIMSITSKRVLWKEHNGVPPIPFSNASLDYVVMWTKTTITPNQVHDYLRV